MTTYPKRYNTNFRHNREDDNVENLPHRSTEEPKIKILPSDPPQLRVNGTIIPWPEGKTPQEAYQDYLTGHQQQMPRPNPAVQSSDSYKVPLLQSHNPPETLHPLRQQHLEDRLKELEYLERQQTLQDSFTTRMYGKKDFSEEKENIMHELQQGKQSILPTIEAPHTKGEELRRRLKRDQDLDKEFGYRNIPQPIQYAIDDYRKEAPEEYQRQKEEQRQWDRDQALGKPFQTQSLEEWKKKDMQFTNKEVHCNTAMGSILKERGIDLPANTSMNDIIKYMKNSPEWKEIPMREGSAKEHQIANEWAQQGHTAVFGQLGDEHGHGGVLTGNPTMFGSGNFRDKDGEKIPVPEIEGSIGKNPITKEHLGWHLTSGENASYFLYVGPEDNNNKQKEQKNE